MGISSFRSLLLAAIVLCHCITWSTCRHHYTHNVNGHRSRHRRQGAGLYLSASYILPDGEGSGAWGDWGEVSPCSRTCGGGVASQKRICLEFGSDGSPRCTGGDTKYFSCQTQDCPDGSGDFRAEQCAEYNNKTFRDQTYNWVPYTKGPNLCELNCMPHGERFYYRQKRKVIDGTRCNDESFDICVDGVCQPVGCDMMLGSNAREDKCRRCRGNGTNCYTTSGLLDSQDYIKGYNDILLIPQGATNILIEEVKESNNYLALRAKLDNTYYLNGDYHIDFPRRIIIAGAPWYYERSQQGLAAPDKLRCLGPTTEPLYLSLLLQDENVGIQYEYSVPSNIAPPLNQQYNWVHEDFSECSATCGGGYQIRQVTCRSREELQVVEERLCDIGLKPPTNQTCNTDSCPPQWVEEPWSPCSKPCGDSGTRTRQVYCQKIISNGEPSIVADKECFNLLGAKPELYQECNRNATCPTWFTEPWKPCDKLCGEGIQTRLVVCHQKINGRVEVYDDEFCTEEKPIEKQNCILHPCEGVDWVLSDWTGCDTCLSTVRKREAQCATKDHRVIAPEMCAYHPAPILEEPCKPAELPGCQMLWYATQWGKCSADCGEGTQTRRVFCGLFNGESVIKVDDSRCDPNERYNDTKKCFVPKDKCPKKWFAGPWTKCSKDCGGGEQTRLVMCLSGDTEELECNELTILDFSQSCNTQPCNEDETIPVNAKTPILTDDYDYEDCEDEDKYPDEAAEVEEITKTPEWIPPVYIDEVEGSGSGFGEISTDEPESTITYTTTEGTTTESETSTDVTESTIIYTTTEGETPESTTSTGETESTAEDKTSESITSTDESTTTYTTTEASTLREPDTTSAPKSSISETDSTETHTSDLVTTETSPTKIDTTGPTETDITATTTTDTVTGEISTTDTGSIKTETTELGITVSTTLETGISEVDHSTDTTDSDTPELRTTETITSEIDSTDISTTEASTIESYKTETVTEETARTETIITESTISSTGTDYTESKSTVTESTETESTKIGTTESGKTETSSLETSITEMVTTDTIATGKTETSPTEINTTETVTEMVTTETTATGTPETTPTEVNTTETDAIGTSTTEIVSTEESSTEAGTTKTDTTEESGSTEASTIETETTGTGYTTEGRTEVVTSESDTTVESTTKEGTTDVSSTESTETGSTGESSTEASTTEAGPTETITSEGSTTEGDITISTTESSTVTTIEGSTATTIVDLATELSTTETTSGTTPWGWTSIITTKKPRCKVIKRKCTRSKFGCCPDGRTAASGPFDEGCPNPKTCVDSSYGCCPDGVSAATGLDNKGCPVTPCNETLYGCCKSDNITAAEGNDQDGCPPPPPACKSAKFGCCDDEITEARGPEKEGCPEPVTETEKPTTTEAQGCVTSEFGCCYDNETDASGPNGEGCPCSISQFGCCPDGDSTALGPNLEGCVMTCKTSAYGCCADGETPAHGPDQEGCCLQTRFGCCPDNFKAAEGPDLEGCDCAHAHFGCCPDNVTIARGPNNEGCGCQYTQYGCCEDRYTRADGPQYTGCSCHTYQFGCCPDGVTVAMGPNLQGCLCDRSTYGCCGDGTTAAKGPNMQGCDCSTSKYGCCPDGITEARGKNFLNCTDLPDNSQAACALRIDRGSGNNYTVNWFYDMEYGGCSRFWYSGSEGNGNRFGSQAECEDVCVHPSPKDACKLPMVKGVCTGYIIRWYYDSEREQCSQFAYGGCLGNSNNFESQEFCQNQCEPERTEDQCNLEIDAGSCAGNYVRWAYSSEGRRCEQFTWGGCEGNSNRFSSKAACQLRCDPPGQPIQACSLPQEVGNCTEKHAVWSFNTTENRCVPFYYTGCGGNDNRFDTERACKEDCPAAYEREICTLPALTGECSDYTAKWFYDTSIRRCRQFYYGGCGGNENNFLSERECENACIEFDEPITLSPTRPSTQQRTQPPTVLPTQPATQPATQVTTQQPTQSPSQELRPDYCYLAIDSGPCPNSETAWAFNSSVNACVPFDYSGCGGNNNNFPTEEYCVYYCKPDKTGDLTDVCQQPFMSGSCDQSLMVWFYDASQGVCSQFSYSGCGGNDNRFESRDECENRCTISATTTTSSTTTTTTTTTTTPEPIVYSSECQVPDALEECREPGQVWYRDTDKKECVPYINPTDGVACRYTGVFTSEEACERTCGAFRDLDVCRSGVDAGPCYGSLPKVYYNTATERCENFMYGGCLGGPNRFSSFEECEQVCRPANIDPCSQTAEQGNCTNYSYQWYYEASRDDCQQFIYGGCNGNDNRFESREECESRCKKISTTTTSYSPLPTPSTTTTTVAPFTTTHGPIRSDSACETPASLVPCGGNITVYYYDSSRHACVVGDFGGCGYQNSYRTEEECERQCGAFQELDVCQYPLEAGSCSLEISKYYWDQTSGRCLPFTFSGCDGGPNRFSNAEECEEVCGNSGPDPACLGVVSSGSARCGSPERRWYYDADTGDCLVFVFRGCDGNNNNFASYEECNSLCRRREAQPRPNVVDTSPEVHVSEGGTATLKCLFYGNPPPKITWRRGALLIEGDLGRYRLLSDGTLEIASVYRNDSGVYICIAENEYGNATQEVLLEVDEPENNEVDCNSYDEECASLICKYGVQRTHSRGCERCTCVPEDVNCALLRSECDNLKCTFGKRRETGPDGCERCTCNGAPCADTRCNPNERCVTSPYRNSLTLEVLYTTECRIVNKTGWCPENIAAGSERQCKRECNDDADCLGVGKCCERGCGSFCLEPILVLPTQAPTSPPEELNAPSPNVEETQPVMRASEGGRVALKCVFHGNPPPKITWRWGAITIEGDLGRYRLLSDGSLEIVSLYRNDSGVYICVADNEYGHATQEIRLEVADPVNEAAGIAGEPNTVIRGEYGQPVFARCLSYGYPEPAIYWYHGRNGPMVPYTSSNYEARDNILNIRKLTPETVGEYVCMAYNGIGKPAEWSVIVEAYTSDEVIPALVPRIEVVTEEAKTEATTPTTPPAPLIDIPVYTVPVRTRILSERTRVIAGSEINLPCDVDGYPLPAVHWTKDGSVLDNNERITVTEARLTVLRANSNDSGVYGCHAANQYSQHYSTIAIRVEGLYIPPNCKDNPYFATCHLIVKSKFCQHEYYSKFCCKSCVEAGQLDPNDLTMQADSWMRRK